MSGLGVNCRNHGPEYYRVCAGCYYLAQAEIKRLRAFVASVANGEVGDEQAFSWPEYWASVQRQARALDCAPVPMTSEACMRAFPADSSSAAPVDEHAPRLCEAKVLGGTCEPAAYAIDWEMGTKVYCERCADGFVIVANNVGQKLAIRELPRTAKATAPKGEGT